MTKRRAFFAILLVVVGLIGLGISWWSGWDRWVVGSCVAAWFVVRIIQRQMKG